ncbi:MAG TPA: hypothetical protein VMT93_02040 [Gemmatimonadaceae bacterium]|nr:hypothetical protein [Gemmatimonadaceae bacterium]
MIAAPALEADGKRARFAAVRELLAAKGLLAPSWPTPEADAGPVVEPDALPTGLPALDRLLPGGFPRRAVSEVLGPVACGKTTLVAHAVAAVTRARRLAAWIDPRGEAYPPAFARAGVELSRLLWVRPHGVRPGSTNARDALWAAEVLLQSAAFEVVVLDASGLTFEPHGGRDERGGAGPKERATARMALERRAVVLRTAAETAGVALVVLGERGLPAPGAPPALTLEVEMRAPQPPPQSQSHAHACAHVRVARSRWGGAGREACVELGEWGAAP